MGNALKKKKAEPEVDIHDPSTLQGKLKVIGGSLSDDWNNVVANQLVSALWLAHCDSEELKKRRHAAVDALICIGPRDDLEGMMAVQMIACHNASMECYRRAMIPEQSFEGRREALSQANKLSRTYVTLLDGLNRHRGKGAQKVTVEHVHVHKGGQAIVGNVSTPGGGVAQKTEEQPHALGYAPGATMPSTDAERDRVPVTSDEERPMSDARRPIAGRS